MSSNHEVTRERQPAQQQNVPEIPRRPRSTQNGISSNNGASQTTNSNSQQPPAHPPQPAVREIHKNAWLKRITANDKKGTFVKKYDKLWVVFCVHDDVEAFLEFYPDPKMAASHRPNGYLSLNSCLHVSQAIIGEENNEYQFAVTLSTQVIRLVAANWDQMIEWVESLQGKLREMNILSPKDNLYSKLPETRNWNYPVGYISTRDPNSPLPPTPNGYSSPVLGTESSLYLPISSASINPDTDNHSAGAPGSSSQTSSVRSVSNINVNSVLHSTPVLLLNEQYVVSGGTASIYVQPSSRDGSGSDSGNGSGGSIMSIIEPRVTVFPISVSSNSNRTTDLEHQNESTRPLTPSPSVSVITGNSNSTVVQVGSDENHYFTDSSHLVDLSSISLISSDAPATSHSQPIYRRVLKKTAANTSADTQPIIPVSTSSKVRNHTDLLERQLSAPSRPNSSSSENIYEHLFVPEINIINSNSSSSGQRNSNGNDVNFFEFLPSGSVASEVPPAVPRRDLHKKLSTNSHRSSSLNRLEDQNGSRSGNSSRRNQNGVQEEGPDTSHLSNHYRLNHKDLVHRTPVNGSHTSGFAHAHGLEGDPMEALIGVRSGEYRIRREEASGVQPQENETDFRNGPHRNHASNLMSHVPLKEQQVMRLRAEINHPGGVRVVLRKKDCSNSLGLVDYLGAVWVAGWKQQQHPVLYYAFHVGDQILKVAGVTVQSSVDAHRAIKMASNLQIEFIIRRIPNGNVFVLKRSRECEPLGLVAINNTPEIGEVLKDGLSANQGLPPTCRGADGQSNCTWFLTEVNNRPLSLVARENEVRDRLNAVGKEISILVQPSDLVKHLKKQLKSMKGFKDYLVV